MSLSTLGEFGFIDRIRQRLAANHPGLSVGIGDDAAVFSSRDGWQWVWSVDALVEGVHFDRSYVPMESLGWKSLAVNLSDIAAMGAEPRYALISLAVPDTWSLQAVDAFYQGLESCSETYHCPLIGGDTTGSKKDGFISITLLGEVETGSAVLRSGAKVGDFLFCTGRLGGARAGWEILSHGTKQDVPFYEKSIRRFLYPEPRVEAARWLVKEIPVSAMIDISDGLSSEIHHICRESKVGCVMEESNVPVLEDAARWFEEKGQRPVEEAIISGEEYQLLFTASVDHPFPWIKKAREQQIEIFAIGQIVEAAMGVTIRTKHGEKPLMNRGWNHFQ